MNQFNLKSNRNSINQGKTNQSVQVLRDFSHLIHDTYSAAKSGIDPELIWENTPITIDKTLKADCGIVTGKHFTIEKIDLYGNNPMYYYKDDQGKIFIQTCFLENSSIQLKDQTKVYFSDLSTHLEALEYLHHATTMLTGTKEMKKKVRK